jgi:hypothetical protein
MPYSRPAGDGVEGDVRQHLALVDPRVRAVVAGRELRCEVDVLRRQSTLEEVRRLDHVVVDAHEDHVVDLHRTSPSTHI